MKRSGWWCVVVLAVGLAVTVVRPVAAAASFTLTPRERDEAIQMGKRSIISEDFGREWKISGDTPGQAVLVVTPFHRLALAARNSAFKEQELKGKEIDNLLKEQEGTLTLWATLRGGKIDFARFYSPVLVSGPQEIKPSFTQNERTARREDDGTYTAQCMYVFRAEQLKPHDKLTLLVRDAEGRPVAKFAVDLSTMR
ncbi:MAG TPA: hypothetical protein VGT40_00020 [Methylomirabilota bacterium]|nr:hypothetical protein [Methylomirabilota bacterium]